MIRKFLERDHRLRSFLISIIGGLSLLILAGAVFAVASQARALSAQAENAVQTVENLRVASLARAELSVASRVGQAAPEQRTIMQGSINNATAALDSVEANFDPETPQEILDLFSAYREASDTQADIILSEAATADDLVSAEIATGEAFARLGDAMRQEQLRAIEELRTDNDLMNLIATISTFTVAFVVPSAALFIFHALRTTPRELRTLRLEHDSLSRSSRTMASFVSREAHELRTHLLASSGTEIDEKLLRSLLRFEHIGTVNGAPKSLRNSRVDLNELVTSSLSKIATKDAVSFRAGNEVSVIADRNQMELVVIELVQNALSHGEAPVRVVVDRDDTSAIIRVIDSGPGLPAIVEDAVIDENEFALRGNAMGGTYGFGLLAIRRSLEAMGGKLTYGREAGHTTLTATIPEALLVSPGQQATTETSTSEDGQENTQLAA